MKPTCTFFSTLCILFLSASIANAQKQTVLAGTASNSNTSEFAAKVREAGLSRLLSGKGSFTIFAPTNDKFNPGNAKGDALRSIVSYYIVPGKIDSKVLARDIEDGSGRAIYTSLEGGKLWAMKEGDRFVIHDEKGNTVTIREADHYMSNGVIHQLDGVALQQ